MNAPRCRHSQLENQRGSAALLFALFLPVLLGFAALAVDLARVQLTRIELQNAADAAAMAGARSLDDPGGDPYNWTAAETVALEFARRNVANGEAILDAEIETGYWNIPDPSLGLHGAAAAGDVPAVRARISLAEGRNGGPLPLFFAPILDIADSEVRAEAVAVIAAPAGGSGLFPFVIGKKMLDHYWDTLSGSPVLDADGEAPSIRLGSVYTFDGQDVLSGQWTTFQSDQKNPDVPFMRDLIERGNTTALSIGDDTYIQPGAKATLYSEVPVGTDVAIFVVEEVDTDSFEPIVAIAGFHIDGFNQGGKYITGHFIDMAMFAGLDPGSGEGIDYGARTPPILVQ
ncbi:hypothetical protein E0L29_09050 [Chlorobium sp. N1]|nr:hypothetical protein E0L29_09050 [Chlorobium sp. N1]